MSDYVDTNGDRMVPLRCELCGEQIGLKSPSIDEKADPNIVARCYACAATEEAEAITESVT